MINFPVKGGGDKWTLTAEQIETWAQVYQGVNVERECKKAWAWIVANDARRKTAKGMPRFLVNWLSRAEQHERVERVKAKDWRPVITPVRTEVMAQIIAAAKARG